MSGETAEGGEVEGQVQEPVIDEETKVNCVIQVQRVCKGHMARRRYKAVSSGLVHPDPKKWKTLQMLSGGMGLDPINVSLGKDWKADLMPHNDLEVNKSIGVVMNYVGDLDAGKRWHGKGTAEFWNGATYNGDFSHGNMHGTGEYVWPDGCRYTGEVNHNELTGQGRLDWPNGDWYAGSIQKGRRHGVGKFVKCKEGGGEVRLWYEGDWVYGERHGTGKLVIEQTGEWYLGTWCHGEKHGEGTMQYRTGNVYVGQWKAGKREGIGRMQWLDANELYIGEWVEGRQHGTGTHFWLPAEGDTAARNLPALNYYDGEWRDGLRSGTGTFNYADGSHYKGRWADNFKHGPGAYTSAQGQKTVGTFDKGHLVAPGAGEQFIGPNSRVGKAAVPTGDGDILLHVDDLVTWAENGERVVSQVKKVLLSYVSELRVIFQTYAQSELFAEPEPKEQPKAGSSARLLLPRNPLASEFKERQERQLAMLAEFGGKSLPMRRMLQLARDCKLQDGNLPLIQIQRIVSGVAHGHRRSFARLLEAAPGVPSPSDAASAAGLGGNSEKRLLFSEFLEALVRLADVKYEEVGALPQRVSFCLYRNIFPHVNTQGPLPGSDDPDMQLALADDFFPALYQQCLQAELAARTRAPPSLALTLSSPDATLTTAAAAAEGAGGGDGAVAVGGVTDVRVRRAESEPEAPTLRRVLSAVEDAGMVDAKMSLAKTLGLMAGALFPDAEDCSANLGNLEVPVTFAEFIDVLRALAACRFEDTEAPDSPLLPLKMAIQTRAEGLELLANAEEMSQQAASEDEIQAVEHVLARVDQTLKDAFSLGRGKAKQDNARFAAVQERLEAARQALQAPPEEEGEEEEEA